MLFKRFKKSLTVDLIDSCLTAVFILFFNLNSLAFSESCQILNTDNNRRKEIHFNDGRTIEVIGHNHGETLQISNLHSNVVKNSYSNNDDYLQFIYDDLKKLKETTQHARQDLQHIREKASNQVIQFIAVENGAINFPFFKKNALNFLSEVSKQRELRQLSNNEIIESLFDGAFLTFAGAARYLKITEPLLMKNIEIIGVDDDTLVPKNLNALGLTYLYILQLSELYPKNTYIADVITKMQTIPDYLFNEQHLSQKSNLYASIAKSNHYLLNHFFQAAKNLTRLQKQRDQNMVQNLLNEKSSGILLVGLAHLKSITELLKQHCQQNSLQMTAKTKLRF